MPTAFQIFVKIIPLARIIFAPLVPNLCSLDKYHHTLKAFSSRICHNSVSSGISYKIETFPMPKCQEVGMGQVGELRGRSPPPKNSQSPPSALEYLKIAMHCQHSRNFLVSKM